MLALRPIDPLGGKWGLSQTLLDEPDESFEDIPATRVLEDGDDGMGGPATLVLSSREMDPAVMEHGKTVYLHVWLCDLLRNCGMS